MIPLAVAPLTRAGFAPFGEVIECDGATHYPINQGYAERFHDLARVEVSHGSGQPIISIFRGDPRTMPIHISLMERHPLGSQAFYPLQRREWLLVVAGDPLAVSSFRAFRAKGTQGVNYARNTWHHPLLVLDEGSEFLIVDRKGPGNNLEEMPLAESLRLDF